VIFLTIIKTSLKSLYANKMRSALAMLGIIIGVGSVISMMSIGAGVKSSILTRISSMGTNLLMIRPSQGGGGGVMGGSSNKLTLEDAEAVLEKVPSIKMLTPTAQGNAQLKYMNKNSRTSVVGTAVTYEQIGNLEVENGRFFREGEANTMARVAVIGPTTAENLGITKSMIGENMKVNGLNFRVIGILKAKGSGGFDDTDDRVYVPYTTAMKILFGLDNIGGITVQAEDGADLTAIQTKITTLLRTRHRLADSEENDFRVMNQAELIQTVSDTTKTFTFLLGGIAAISLLVGGIGIMNIMLVTVTERTKEIGIRKAIGAKNRDIQSQFLIESMIMSGLGGLFGAILGVSASQAISAFSTFTTMVEPSSILLSLSFSFAIGVFFGYYPAYRAAMLDPIECLHYE
jgi:putative ABC transport system permease protein